MNMKLIALLLVAVMIAICSGCTGGDKPEDTKDVGESSVQSTETSEEVYGPIVYFKGKDRNEIGLKTVCINGKYGYQDDMGNYVVEPKYSFAHDFVGCEGRYFTNVALQNYFSNEDLGGVYGIAVVEQHINGEIHYGLINEKGEELIKPKYKTSLLGFYKHDFVPIRYSENGETLYKYIDVFGDNAAYRDIIYTSVGFSSEYVYASEFDDNGLAIVASEVHTYRSGSYITWTLIEDKLGNRVGCYFSADKISKYDDMYYLVENEGLFGLCDTNGQLVTEIIFESPESIVIE